MPLLFMQYYKKHHLRNRHKDEIRLLKCQKGTVRCHTVPFFISYRNYSEPLGIVTFILHFLMPDPSESS